MELGSARLQGRLGRVAESVRATVTERGGLDDVERREVCFLIVREAGRFDWCWLLWVAGWCLLTTPLGGEVAVKSQKAEGPACGLCDVSLTEPLAALQGKESWWLLKTPALVLLHWSSHFKGCVLEGIFKL